MHRKKGRVENEGERHKQSEWGVGVGGVSVCVWGGGGGDRHTQGGREKRRAEGEQKHVPYIHIIIETGTTAFIKRRLINYRSSFLQRYSRLWSRLPGISNIDVR